MKIAFITDEYPYTLNTSGGLATYVQNTAKYLSSIGNEVHVFVPGSINNIILDDGVQVHIVNKKQIEYKFKYLNKKTLWKFYKLFDVLTNIFISYKLSKEFNNYEKEEGAFKWVQISDYMFRGLFVRKLNRPIKVRCSWSRDLFLKADDVKYTLTHKIYGFLERLQMRRADELFAPSKFLSEYFKSQYSFNVKVIRTLTQYNSPKFDDTILSEIKKPYLLHFGIISKRKGSDYVIEAIKILTKRGIRLRVYFVGKDLYSLAHNSDLADLGIVYLGSKPRSQINSLIQNCEAAILPSRIDNIPNTVIECITLSKPFISMNKSSVEELVNDSNKGVIVEQGDVFALSEEINKIWQCLDN
jgi:glycosyltransferase involved in cell wall biosynthesis